MPSVDTLLLTADNFLVLSATPDVSNTGSTVLTGGNLGVYPAASVIGFPPGIVTAPGTTHAADATALQAQTDAQAAYTYFKNLAGGTPIVGNLAGQILAPGIYTSGSTMDLAVGGTLTLDGGGNQNALFVFQLGSALTLNNGSTIRLQNGANARNIVWVAGSSITVGTTAVVNGNLIAGTGSVTLAHLAVLNGRAISLIAEVTLDDNAITVPAAAPPIPPGPFPPAPPIPAGNGSAKAYTILSEICHPDCTGKTLRSWGLVSFVFGFYTVGGLSMGLMNYLDVRTCDFYGFLKCDVWGEEPISGLGLYEYHYSPVGDVLQIFNANGTELSNGAALPLEVLSDVVLFEVTVDRCVVRG